MVRMFFWALIEFIPSLDSAYAHLIPIFPRTEETSKEVYSHELIYVSFAKHNHLISSFLEKNIAILPRHTGFLTAYLEFGAWFFIAFFTDLAP